MRHDPFDPPVAAASNSDEIQTGDKDDDLDTPEIPQRRKIQTWLCSKTK